MESKILAINEINDAECQVSYEILNNRKDVIYKKSSRKLLSCINKYINILENKKKILKDQNEKKIYNKKIMIYVIVLLITFVLVYYILTNLINKTGFISIIGYITSLLLISISFLTVHFITYKNDLILENEYLKIENEILEIKNIKNNCLKLINLKK